MDEVASIDASSARTDREFGADVCRAWGIDPNRVTRLVYYYDPATCEGIVEFWGFEQIEGMWAHEVNAPSLRGGHLVKSPLRHELVQRVRYTVESMASMPEWRPYGP